MISNANPWDNLKFDLEELLRCVENSLEHYTTPIRSLVCMLILMDLNMKKQKFQLNERNWSMDYLWVEYFNQRRRWFYADYEPTKAARAISEFVQKRVTGTFVCVEDASGREYAQDKIAAYQTLYTCLLTISKLGRLLHLSLWINFTET
jgi:isoleucyl-tRNA synthetase